MPTSNTAAPRLGALDGLRGIAAVWIVLFHVPWPSHLQDIAPVRSGYLAVDLFFILSGFVIARSYGTRLDDRAAVGRFLTRRFLRIYPLHAVTLACLVGLELLKLAAAQRGATPDIAPFTGPNGSGALAANLAMVHGWGGVRQIGWNAPSWSISVEALAYLLFALATWGGFTRRISRLAAAAIAGLCADVALVSWYGTLDLPMEGGLVRCLAGFSVGVLLERLSAIGRLPAWIERAQLPLVAAIVAVASLGGVAVALAPFLFALLVASLHADRGPLARLLNGGSAQHLGQISFSLYLVQYPLFLISLSVLKRVGDFGPTGHAWRGDLLAVGFLGLLWVVARLSYRFIEEPGRRLGGRAPALPRNPLAAPAKTPLLP